jgi:2-dehydro-3-deoxygalactonokinase
MQEIALLAIDWGTSSTRVYAMDRQGLIRDARSAPLGVQRVANGEFAKALKTLCGDDFPAGVPVIACGMIAVVAAASSQFSSTQRRPMAW